MVKFINLTLIVMLLLLCLFSIEALAEPSMKRLQPRYDPKNVAYIKASCQTTLYPDLCLRSLHRFAGSDIQSPQHLTHVALSVSLSRALHTRDYLHQVSKHFEALKDSNNPRDYYVVQDCMKQIDDSVDELGNSIRELERLTKIPITLINDNVLWHISNVETWMSTALTDVSTCVDYFTGHRMSKMKAAIRGQVLNVAQVTSNALALFHRYAAKYREAAQAKRS